MYKTETHLTHFRPLVYIWNNYQIPKLSCASTRNMQQFYNKIKSLPSKMQEEFKSQEFYPFGPLVCIWNNFQIPKLSCASTRYMQPFYNKIKSLPSKMQEEFKSQECVTDGRTDRRTDGGNDNIPELSFESAGIKK